MVAGLAVLLVVGIVLGVLGLLIKGLLWLAVIGIVCIVGGILLGLWRALTHSRPHP